MQEKGDLYIKVLKILRDKKMTQMELAEKMNIKQASLSKILSGKNSSRIATIQKIADALNVPINYFINGNENISNGNQNDINIISRVNLLEEKNKTLEEKIKRLETELELLRLKTAK